MDTPRRWQVASLAVAAISLGLGAVNLGRSTTESVEPIELRLATASDVPSRSLLESSDPEFSDPDTDDDIEFVPNRVFEDPGAPPPSVPAPTEPIVEPSVDGSPDSAASVGSPDSADSDD